VAEHEAALTLLLSIAPETVREAAWPTAQALLKRHIEDKARIAQGQGLRAALARLEKESESQKTLLRLRDELAQASGQHIASQDELEIFLEAQRTRQEELSEQQAEANQRRASLEHQGTQLGRDIAELTKLAPRWLKSFENSSNCASRVAWPWPPPKNSLPACRACSTRSGSSSRRATAFRARNRRWSCKFAPAAGCRRGGSSSCPHRRAGGGRAALGRL
jgi:hypothetical protein